ncbi:MAG: hypothetical protein J0L79_05880 [Rickettsiales bacterium]|nr:hypothetical protein [Rickettsiales bacterium]MCA0254770.1 hypothetical protein [Pseudomonadota bacterium]
MSRYINSALELYFEDQNKELFLASLKQVIQAKVGITEFSQHAHNQQAIYLYKALLHLLYKKKEYML